MISKTNLLILLAFLCMPLTMTYAGNDSWELLKGAIPQDVRWHNGRDHGTIDEVVNLRQNTITRYRYGDDELLVVRNKKTRKLTDVFRRLSESVSVVEELQESLLELYAGVYQNEKGMSVFGKVKLNSGERYDGDPGSELHFEWSEDYSHVVFSDMLVWGEHRIQQVNAPPNAPPGWGGAGAFTGPTFWLLHYSEKGLEVLETQQGINSPTYPDFGTRFVLKKIRGPYDFDTSPWAIVLVRPLNRLMLSRLSNRQLDDIISEIKKRHADGSSISPLEKLNLELVRTVRNEK